MDTPEFFIDGARETAFERAPLGESIEALSTALRVLDRVLGAAVKKRAEMLGPATLLDAWRGMHLDRSDVERLLADSEAPVHASEGAAGLLASAAHSVPGLGRTTREHSLIPQDVAALLIIIAPDLDLKYEKIYGYLQDDLTRKRPTPDLIANLLALDAHQRLRVLTRLCPNAPLARAGLIASTGNEDSPWLARALAADGTWLNRLLGRDALGAPLASYARLCESSDRGPCDPELLSQVHRAFTGAKRLHVVMSGPHGAGKFALARAVADDLRKRLLVVDARAWTTPAEVRTQIAHAAHAAEWFDALPYLHGIARLQEDRQLLRGVMEALAESSVPLLLASVAPMPAVPGVLVDLVRVEVPLPSAVAREAIWRRSLEAHGRAFEDTAVRQLASRFVLGPLQIEQAVRDAINGAPGRGALLSQASITAASRAQCGAELAGRAQRITPEADLDALVVPSDVHAQLREICVRVTSREHVRREWSAGAVHGRVIGVSALFAGASGTGKTLAAEAIACELGFDLYRIELASIVSKYIGETERNLERVFAAAEHANAVLFFDEADALFGKRSEVKDAHDRYANIEIAYLLQKMERFDGVAVLSTNLKQNLDEAFARRLTFCVNFPFPEQAERRRLWNTVWPPRAPRAPDVDLDWFAREFRLSGGAIRNVVLAAAHLAAEDGQVIARSHLLHATRREFQKLGKNIGEAGHETAGALV
jgi:AAA+ superfamily predicted ATPase